MMGERRVNDRNQAESPPPSFLRRTGECPALCIEGVSKSFAGQPVLDAIDLDLLPGEIVCILGPSGCGKTTLLNIVAGLQRPDAGRVVFAGRIGYVFQDPRLLPWRTVRENIAFGLKRGKTFGVKTRADRDVRPRMLCSDATVQQYMERLGLAGVAEKYPHQLSGGMRQRVTLGRALAIDPDLLLLDEPFKSLDVLLRVELLRLLVEEWKIKPRPVLFVTHEIQEAALVGQRAVVLMGRPARIAGVVQAKRPPTERRPGDEDVLDMEVQLCQMLMNSPKNI